MITKLTKKQVDLLQVYAQEGIQIGLDTSFVPFPKRRKIVRTLCKYVLNKPLMPIICMESPLYAWVAAQILSKAQVWDQVRAQVWDQVGAQVRAQVGAQVRDQVGAQVRDQVGAQVWDQVRDQVWAQVRDQVRDQVRAQVWDQVGAQVRAQVGAQVRDQVGAQVRDQVGAQVWDQVGAQVRAQVRDFVWPYLDGHWSIEYFQWCEYYQRVLKIINPSPQLRAYIATKHLGLIFPLPDVCVVSGKPKMIMRNPHGQLHAEGRAAIQYHDGWSIWALNGVRVPQWLAETRDTDIDPARITECDNAEIRREFIRKVGLDRIYYKLGGRCIEVKHVNYRLTDGSAWACLYKLVELQYANGVTRRVLEMDNPSLPDVKHVEYVPQECATVEAALNFRLYREENQIDDDKGVEWYLHGDVIVTPKGAKKFKRRPIWIA